MENPLSPLQGSALDQLSFMSDVVILNNRLDQLVVALMTILGGWILARIATAFLGRTMTRLAKRTVTKLDDMAISVTRNAITYIIVLLSFSYATHLLTLAEGIHIFISKVVLILLAWKVTSSFLRVFDFVVQEYVMAYAKTTDMLDQTIIPTLERIVKSLVWGAVILMIISNLGYDVTSLIAGLGIGGLAFALAAQDALGNLIGSISLFLDRTFKVGDYIETADFSGTVKSVGLRSTRFNSVQGTEVIVPNKTLANINIENLSRRPKRRIDLSIGLTYETSSAKLKEAMKLLKDIVKANKNTDAHSRVHFSEFADSALILTLTYWIKDTDLEKGQKVQNDINLKIKSEFEKAELDIAYPTQTLYMHQVK